MSASRCAVVGAGLMGAATAWQPAALGEEAVLVESDVPAGDFATGASPVPAAFRPGTAALVR
ncbi:FAD-dependent oxidoreductase [Kocuria nitroreducens]|uniref:FAD-dependent oxidoreductase n=1 Tax=Kocuria nitroreducens TaxID=3058914 RepID=UPI0036D8A0C2